MAKINAAEILAEKYPKIFGGKTPEEKAVEILKYIGLEPEMTKTELAKEIKISAELVLERLEGISESSDFQSMIISLAIARADVTGLSPGVVRTVEKVLLAIEKIQKPDVTALLQGNLKEIGPRRFGKREPINPIGNFDPELDMPPTIEEARYRSNNWQSPW